LAAEAVQIALPMLVETVRPLEQAFRKMENAKKHQRPVRLFAHCLVNCQFPPLK